MLAEKMRCPKCGHYGWLVGIAYTHTERKWVDILTLYNRCVCGCRYPTSEAKINVLKARRT
jgi:hypothetical protein